MFDYLNKKLDVLAEKIRAEKPLPGPKIQTYSELDIDERVPVHVLDNRNFHPGRCQIGRALSAVHLRNGVPIYAGITLGNLTPDEGENLILDMLIGSQAVITPLHLQLVNVPALGAYAESDTFQANVTLVSGGSYASKSLTRGTHWTITAPAGATQAEADQQTWTASGGAFTAAGSVAVATAATTASGFVIWQQDLSTTRTLQDTDQLQVTFTAALTLE